MADTKITALAAITTVDPAADVLPIVDISDTSMAASGTTKKITSNQILGAGGTATLASATITGDLTVDTNVLKVDAANNRVGIGTATPADTLDVNGRVTALRYLSSSSNAALPSFAVSAGNGAYNSGTNEIGFSINSTSAMTLNSTGLGVGVTPTAKLNLATSSGSCIAGMTNGTNSVQYAVDSTGPYIYSITPGAQSLRVLAPTGVAVFTIDGTGNVGVGVTPAGTGGCLQLKSGITFPATQVASSDANTLDDYEEGTWTGTLTGSTANPTTPVTATGRYTKVGRQVSVSINFENVNTTGASGNVGISGLPFTNNASVQTIGPASIYQTGTFTGSPFTRIDTLASAIEFFASVSNAAYSNVTHNAGTGRFIATSASYTVA